MRYRNIVIKCKKKDAEEVQKYLFRLKYHWIDNGEKHRHVKDFNNKFVTENYIYFVIKNDTSFHYTFHDPTGSFHKDNVYLKDEKLQLLVYPQFIRKEKLKKLKNI